MSVNRLLAIPLLCAMTSAIALDVKLSALPAGDGVRADDSYHWLDWSYLPDGQQLDSWRQYWQPGWGRQIAYIEIPLGALGTASLMSATLALDSLGYSTGYYYGSAALTHLGPTPAQNQPTGDLVVDQPAQWGETSRWGMYSSGAPAGTVADGAAGLKTFDVLDALRSDILAGRSFATFAIEASRDTYGAVYAAESGRGAYIMAQIDAVPEPETYTLLLAGLAVLGWQTRRRAA